MEKENTNEEFISRNSDLNLKQESMIDAFLEENLTETDKTDKEAKEKKKKIS